MKILHSILTASALCACVALSACSTSSNGSGAQTNPSVDPTQQGMRAPVILVLRGPDPMPAAGDIKLDLEIRVNEPVNAPTYLKLMVPQGAQLLSGAPQETLALGQPGTLLRSYMVRVNGPLQAPIVAVADAKDPGGAFGFHAERKYPAAAPVGVAPNPNRPPVPRPAGPPR
ncbi:MAG: hypothetical protein HY898_22750 [Deltaproteobacteria bacterium]|nr:hypothetical protein [Deltaproteobacteria bacterium]